MAYNNNKGENEFPYEIKEAVGDMKEQFIRDFQGMIPWREWVWDEKH